MKSVVVAVLAAFVASSAPALAGELKNPIKASATWNDLAGDVLGEVKPAVGEELIALEAPYRAHDAATVPIRITQTNLDSAINELTLVVDENPAPVVAEITFGEAMQPLVFETRVRVDQYSNVRAIASTDHGLHMTGRFVKASGGCSAPATKDMALALAAMGKMKVRHFDTGAVQSNARREAQIMIRHPNYSGLQRDQVTQLFINAHFINEMEVYQGDELLFSLSGGISISENPVFRFEYTDNGAQTLRVRASDTDGNVFEQEFDKLVSS